MTTQTKSQNTNRVVTTQGGSAFAQYYSERKIQISNPQVAKQLRHVEYFGINYSTLMGAFIKASQSGAIRHFDLYVDKLISTTKEMISIEIEKCTKVKASYQDKGYLFVSNVTALPVTIRIYRNCLNDITDLMLDLDQLVTLLNHLEKTPYMKTQTLFSNISEFVMIPKALSDKIFGLTKTLNDQFKFNAKSKVPVSNNVDFSKVNQLLVSYQSLKLDVLAKKVKPNKPVPDTIKISSKVSSTQISSTPGASKSKKAPAKDVAAKPKVAQKPKVPTKVKPNTNETSSSKVKAVIGKVAEKQTVTTDEQLPPVNEMVGVVDRRNW